MYSLHTKANARNQSFEGSGQPKSNQHSSTKAGFGMKHFNLLNRISISGIIVILFILLAPGSLSATNGKITGKVTDQETKEPLIGASVMITHEVLTDGSRVALDRVLGGATDIDGYYVILNVPPGVYIVKASNVGFTPLIQEMVRVDLDRTITVDFQLAPTAIEVQPIVVTANREIIEKDVSATKEVILTTRLAQMPVMRVDEFINRVKGVQLISGADGNGLSVRGGSIRETDVRLDGISLQDPRTENSYLALNSTTIEQIQISTGGFEAKYGGIRSGLLNVVTKDGHRDRYTLSLKADIAPSNQKKYFGMNPYSDSSWIYKVFDGPYAMNGVNPADTTVPLEFRNFAGWKNRFTQDRRLSPENKKKLWEIQHPKYTFADKPDVYIEGSVTGPLPGADIPLLGSYAELTTFLFGFKYEDSQLAFPVGPRNDYQDWNGQLKLTSNIGNNLRLAINSMYANVQTVSGGQSASYGGALVDQSSSFGFLNNTESSVRQQARLLGGDGLWQMYNKSRLQFYDQRYFVGGAKLTHTLSSTSFYTVDFQVGFTDQRLVPFSMDTSRADAWVYLPSALDTTQMIRFLNAPTYGSPNASTNFGSDALGMFRLYGGTQRIDSSKSWVFQLKGDYTTQVGRHHQIEAGFSSRLQDLFVYTGTWLQSQTSFTPDLWQYYRATPLELGAYVQDKLEFEGMILNAGIRLDYLNPMKKGFRVGMPPDANFETLYNNIYQTLPGAWGSYDRWLAYRDQIADPPGWPRTENKIQVHLSPRLGVSFPITETSKLYFNYGHFYQRPAISFMYNEVIYPAAVTVPTPDLAMARTVSYEFGYEQSFLSDFLFNVTAYYKDVRNEPLIRSYINYYHDNIVNQYFPDAYRDIRGVEVRLEKPVGNYLTFTAMYEYMLQSSGQSGVARIYENRLEAIDEQRSANLSNTQPLPRGNVNVNLHTPRDFGEDFIGTSIFGGIYLTTFFEWRAGGQILWNPSEPDVKKQIYLDIVDFWNMDFRGSKTFTVGSTSVELVVTIKNLTNNQWLVPENMTQTQYDNYKRSLKFPFQGGSDKWGQWKSDDNHIDIGWWTAPIFLNPRRIMLGLRVNI
jgi:hypothetical protein